MGRGVGMVRAEVPLGSGWSGGGHVAMRYHSDESFIHSCTRLRERWATTSTAITSTMTSSGGITTAPALILAHSLHEFVAVRRYQPRSHRPQRIPPEPLLHAPVVVLPPRQSLVVHG